MVQRTLTSVGRQYQEANVCLIETLSSPENSVNTGIKKAIMNYDDPHVTFVDIQTDPSGSDILARHPFCAEGVRMPNCTSWQQH